MGRKKYIFPKSINEDFLVMKRNRNNPFVKNGKVDLDIYLQFLNEVNEFMGHPVKKFVPITGKNFKL